MPSPNGANRRSNRARPIHPPPLKPLNKTPDETEPSYSYEERSFLAYDREDNVVDEFHRQFAAASCSGRHNNHHASRMSIGRGFGDGKNNSDTSIEFHYVDSGGSRGGSEFWKTTQPSSSGTKNSNRDETFISNNHASKLSQIRNIRSERAAQRDIYFENNHTNTNVNINVNTKHHNKEDKHTSGGFF